MQESVGVIQTDGFPAVLAAADAMLKGGNVTLVYFDKAERAQFVVAVRGTVSEVKRAMEAGLEAAEKCPQIERTSGEKNIVVSHYIVPNPPDNVVGVLPIEYTEQVEPFRVR